MKRARPFEDYFLPKSKVHLMEFDVDVSALKKMQEKTLKIVMNGPRNYTSPAAEGGCIPVVNWESKRLLKQTEVTNYFNCTGLTRPKSQFEESESSRLELGCCTYCDKTVAVIPCYKCRDNYCEGCSFVSYVYGNDARVCLTCS